MSDNPLSDNAKRTMTDATTLKPNPADFPLVRFNLVR